MSKTGSAAVRSPSPGGIGTMGERSLHAALKDWYSQPGDRQEVIVDGYHIDIVRDDLLIEIQTRNFSSLKRKLATLTNSHRVHLVHPIAREKWIVRLSDSGLERLSRRKSPKHGTLFNVFEELVSIPELIANANFTLEVLMIQEEEIRRKHARGRWRRGGWGTCDRQLLDVVERAVVTSPDDFRRWLPDELPKPFTSADLAEALHQPRDLAQKMVYCLRKLGAIEVMGRQGNAILYAR